MDSTKGGFVLYYIFWISIFLIFYTYFGYLLLLFLLTLFKGRKINKKDIIPSITIIIPVYNQGKMIEDKINNCLGLDYPQDKLEIVVASDGSTDDTDDVVRKHSRQGVKLIRLVERKGKHYAQGEALKIARGEIIVFTDVGISFWLGSLRRLVRNFGDPKVACVSSVDEVVTSKARLSKEALYIRYDMLLRKLESSIGASTGMSGSFYAVRKKFCYPFYPSMSNDFYIPLRAVMQGYKAVLDHQVKGYYSASGDPKDEFIRKTRTIVHGIEVLSKFKTVLNPFKYGFYSIQIISHKLLRWLVPYFLAIIFTTNILLLSKGWMYLAFFLAQLFFYLIALAVHFKPKFNNNPLSKISYFFALTNLSILVSWYKYFSGERYVLWEPTKR
jgi:glycosyltransferase involved in cell wall biosynthesis